MFFKATLDHSQYQKIFQKLFPTAVVHPYKDRYDQMREYIEARLDGVPRRTFSEDELQADMAVLNELCFDDPKDYLEKPKSLWKKAGFTVKRGSNEKSKPSYFRFRYLRIDPEADAQSSC